LFFNHSNAWVGSILFIMAICKSYIGVAWFTIKWIISPILLLTTRWIIRLLFFLNGGLEFKIEFWLILCYKCILCMLDLLQNVCLLGLFVKWWSGVTGWKVEKNNLIYCQACKWNNGKAEFHMILHVRWNSECNRCVAFACNYAIDKCSSCNHTVFS